MCIVIVAFLSAEDLRHGLPPLLEDPLVERVVVVDNSQDEQTRLVCSEYAGKVEYVASENVGFARGCNLGATRCAEDHLLFLNPDVLLQGPLEPLTRVLAANGAAIAAGALMTGGTVSNIKALATPRVELRKALLGANRAAPQRQDRLSGGVQRVEQLDGAFLLMHVDTWSRLSGFDERFELYYEDVDLCRRAVALGGCVIDTSHVSGEHIGGASFGKAPASAYVALRVSRLRYLRKHYRAAGTVAAVLAAAIELFTRGLTRQSEGGAVRRAAWSATRREVLKPGSQQVLAAQPT